MSLGIDRRDNGLTFFAEEVNRKAKQVHQIAVDKGFWGAPRSVAELIALMHSELSEALESDREGNTPDKNLGHRSGLEVEFADCIIRIFDACAWLRLDIGGAIEDKIMFNKTREHKHGKKY